MDGSRFDAWTRRRVGIASGFALTTTLGLVAREDGAAKKNKKKKCCGSLKCDTISFEPSTQTRCCRTIGKACAKNIDCCDQLCCDLDGACTDFCQQ